MRRPRALIPLVLAAGLAGCAGAPSGDLSSLADQADRVGALVEQGHGCRAVEAARTLQTMADDATDAAVRDAVRRFAASAQQRLACDPTTEATPEQTAAPTTEPGKDEDKGRGPDKADDDEGGGPGKADEDRGRGNDEGRGNGTKGHERDEEARGGGDEDGEDGEDDEDDDD